MSAIETCYYCVFHDNNSHCQMPRLMYGEDWDKETGLDSSCEMFTQGMHWGLRTVAITPGIYVAEQMIDKKLHADTQIGKKDGRTVDKDISGVLVGSTRVDDAVAEKLEKTFGVQAQFWKNLQVLFDEKMALIKMENQKQS